MFNWFLTVFRQLLIEFMEIPRNFNRALFTVLKFQSKVEYK